TLAALVQRGLLEVRPGEGEEGADDDHVAVVVRRQALLAPLEGQPFVPVQEPVETATDEDVAEAPDHDAPDTGAAASGGASAAPEHEIAAQDDSDGAEDRELATASAGAGPTMLGGAHVPQDVVPPRPEPFLPKRQADFDEAGAPTPSPGLRTVPVQAG